MANEFKHKDPCSTLTQAEYIAACGDGHVFASQATGDILYASSTTVLSRLEKGAAGTVLSMGCSCIPAWTTNAASATVASTVVVVDGTDTSSFVAIFDSATGSLAPKTDAGLAYNAGTGTLTATAFAGPITGNVTGNASGTALTVTQAAQGAITSLGTLTGLTLSGDATLTGAATDFDLIDNNACAISFDAAGQAGILAIDTQNCAEGVKMSGKLTVTGAISTTGAVTVGACDTGLDVKFFGAAAGAFMLWDEDQNLLDIRGATAAGPGHLKLTTGELTVVANDVLGRIDFQAPLEADCSADARLVGASIAAVAGGTFADALNATDIVFYTGHSETAAEKFRFTSQGEIGIFTSCAPAYGSDGQVLTSTGAGTAVAWEDAGGAVSAVANGCDDRVATFSSSTALNGEATLTYDGEHLTIADGNLIIGTAGHGIDFAAQTAASGTGVTPGNEVLNHYEEGTFVPTLLDDSQSASESQGYDEALGFYTRIGNTVHINFSLTVNSFGTLTTSQSILLGGLPFTSANVTGNRHAMAVGTGYSIAVTSGESMTIYMNPNKALLSINLWDTAAGTTPMTLAELSSNAAIYVSGSYKV